MHVILLKLTLTSLLLAVLSGFLIATAPDEAPEGVKLACGATFLVTALVCVISMIGVIWTS